MYQPKKERARAESRACGAESHRAAAVLVQAVVARKYHHALEHHGPQPGQYLLHEGVYA